MNSIHLFKKQFQTFARKIKKNLAQVQIKTDGLNILPQQQESPLDAQKTLQNLLEMGYSEAEVVKIIQSKRYNQQIQENGKQQQNEYNETVPQKIQNQIQDSKKINEIIEQYKQKGTYLLKQEKPNNELMYEDLLDQIIDGNSIIDNETYKKAQNLAQKIPFSRKDLIKIEKQRQLKLEQRAEIELVKNQLLEESNFERQNFDDQDYNFVDDQDEDFQEDQVEPMNQQDVDFQRDWVKQIDDASLTGKENAALENMYMEKYNITRKQAKSIIRKEFFEKRKAEKKENIREQANKQRERRKTMQKLFNTIQKRSLQKLDYENEEGYSKEKDLQPGIIHEDSIMYNEALKKFQERINSDKKQVLYDKWEIAKKRYSKNVKLIIEDTILESKFGIYEEAEHNKIFIEDVIVSDNAHFLYVLWDFLDQDKNKLESIQNLKQQISVNLNKTKFKLESKLFFELGLRKKPNVVFVHSDKNQQVQMYKDQYIKEELQKKLQKMQLKQPDYIKELIDSGSYQKYIDKQTEFLELQVGDQFDDYFSAQVEMRKKEKQIKKQLQNDKKIKKDNKNRHQHQKKNKKKKLNKTEQFWNKISINQTSNIEIPGYILTTLKQNLLPLGEISRLPKKPQ